MRGHLLKVCVVVAATAAMVAATVADEEADDKSHEPVSINQRKVAAPGMARRVAVLEETISRLAAVVDGNSMDRRVAALEQDAVMLTLLSSRLRTLEAEQLRLNDELASVRRGVRRWKQEVEALRREVLQSEALTGMKVDPPVCCLSLNESIHEAEERQHGVNASLYDLHLQLHNLSRDLHDLQQRPHHQPLLLCPRPYTKVDGHCFHLLERRLRWEEARTACSEQGEEVGGNGDLATPGTNLTTFRAYIETLQTDSRYLWMGGMREEGKWQWVSGSRGEDDLQDSLGLPWDIGEPDNASDQWHLCIHSTGNLKFHDCTHTATLHAVCQVT